MTKQQLNKLYYQTHKELIKERQKERYYAKKQQQKKKVDNNLANYYQANNIKVLISLKDYLESSPDKMKLWYRFTSILNQIKDGIADIMEIMRLREVMKNLISDYWATAKKNIRLTKQWNKLTPTQQETKRKLWKKQLEQEEKELFQHLERQEKNIKSKQQKTPVFNYQTKEPKGKLQCSECHNWVKELDPDNDMCFECVKNYE